MTFKVHVEPSGHEFPVEAGETVLDAALRHGLAFPYGCRNGACGTCLGQLVAGEVDYGKDLPVALDDAVREAGLAVFCQAVPTSDLIIRLEELGTEAAIPVKSMPAKVARMERLADDVMALSLKLPDADRMRFLAGQYVNIVLKDGKKRAFSLANPPHRDEYLELHLRRIPGGVFTDHVFNEMREKDILRIEGPHGSFYLREDSKRPILLLATGTGIAPLKAIIEHALAEGTHRQMTLYWGARSESDLYLHAELLALANAQDNFTYRPVLSQAGPQWRGRTGHLQGAVLEDFADLREYEVYACGLPAMVYSARDALVSSGLDPDHYYSDAFEYAKDSRVAEASVAD